MAATPPLSIRVAANLDDLRAQLAQGISQIQSTTSGMQKLASSLDGSRLAQQAQNIVSAVQQVGGVASLTSAEIDRMSGTLDRAISKYETLGTEAPAAMTQLREQMADAQKSTESLASTISEKLTGAVGEQLASLGRTLVAAFAVEKIGEMVKSVFDLGASLTALSESTGIGVEDLQRLKFAGDQLEVPLEVLAQSIDRMQKNLIDATPQVTAAMGNLGLSLKTLQNESPAQAFQDISEAMSRVPNHAQAVADAYALMGRVSPQVIALMLSDIKKLEDGALTMSKEQVDALAAAKESWTKFGDDVLIVTGQILAGFEKDLPAAESGWKKFFGDVDAMAKGFTSGGVAGAQAAHLDYMKGLSAAAAAAGASAETARPPIVALTEAQKLSAAAADLATHAYDSLDPSIKRFVASEVAAGKSSSDIAKALVDAGVVTKEYQGAVTQLAEADKKAADEANKQADAMAAIAEATNLYQMAVDDLIPAQSQIEQDLKEHILSEDQIALKYGVTVTAVKAVAQAEKDREEAAKSAAKAAIEANDHEAQSDAILQGALEAYYQQNLKDYNEQQAAEEKAAAGLDELLTKVQALRQAEFDEQAKDSLGALKDGIQVLVSSGIPALAEIGRLSGEVTNSFKAIGKGLDNIGNEGESTFQNIEGIVGVVGGVVGMIASIGSALVGLFHNTAGRDLVTSFAQSQGGFDQLHAALDATGDAGEIMWKKLAQVGQGDAAQAQAIIQQTQNYLDGLDQATKNVIAAATATPGDALKDLNNDIQKYKVSIQQLGPAWKQQNLTLEAQDLIGSYTRLTGAGVSVADTINDMSGIVEDANGTITGFSGGLDQLLNDAITTGAALPDQFRPILQALVDSGNAVDSTGKKITSLAGVNFSQSLDQQFQTLIDKITQLIDKLTGGLLPALNAVNNTPINDYAGGLPVSGSNNSTPAKGGSQDAGGAGTPDTASGDNPPDWWSGPVGDAPITPVDRSGFFWLKAGKDVYGMPSMTSGLGGSSSTTAPIAGSSSGGAPMGGQVINIHPGAIQVSLIDGTHAHDAAPIIMEALIGELQNNRSNASRTRMRGALRVE